MRTQENNNRQETRVSSLIFFRKNLTYIIKLQRAPFGFEQNRFRW